MSIDLEHLRQWLGRTETVEERLAAFPANALAATLDRADPPYMDGSALPPLWHWLHFLVVSPMAEAGPDGHPQRGGFLPPVPLPRRMWAGSRLTFHHPLRIGEVARRVSTIASIEHKAGRSGDLVFVTVRHELSGTEGLAIRDEQDIVYWPVPQPGAAAPTMIPAPKNAEWEHEIPLDPVLLFRYSALTFNSHRIHYDQPYVTGVEDYPGLVVHAPLIATLLLDGLRREHPELALRNFSFRAIAPVEVADVLVVCGSQVRDGRISLWARKKSGALAMDAQAEAG